MSLRAVSGSSTISAIFERMNAAAAALASGFVAMSLNVPNMNRNPLPLSQFSWNTRRRSSSETLIASTPLSSNPKATTELRTWSQIASKSRLGPVDLGLVHRAVARRHAVLRRALEDREVTDALGGGGDELGAGRAGADHPDPLAGDVEVVGPGVGVHQPPGEACPRPGMSGMLLLASSPSALTR